MKKARAKPWRNTPGSISRPRGNLSDVRFGFTTNGVLADQEMAILLSDDAKTLGLAQPVVPTKVFDFSPQREVNKELGIR